MSDAKYEELQGICTELIQMTEWLKYIITNESLNEGSRQARWCVYLAAEKRLLVRYGELTEQGIVRRVSARRSLPCFSDLTSRKADMRILEAYQEADVPLPDDFVLVASKKGVTDLDGELHLLTAKHTRLLTS